MTDSSNSTALVLRARDDIVRRLDRFCAAARSWSALHKSGRPVRQGGAFAITIPNASREAAIAALSWAAETSDNRRESTLVVDFCWRGDGVTRLARAADEIGVRDILRGAMLADDRIISALHIDFLPVGRSRRRPPGAREIQKLRGLLEFFRTTYDHVFVICDDPAVAPHLYPALTAFDGVILAVVLGETKTYAVQRTKRAIEQSGATVGGVLACRPDSASARWIDRLFN